MKPHSFVLLLILLVSQKIFSRTATWDGGAGTLVWTTAANWDTDVAPVAGDDIVFNTAGTYTITAVPTLAINSLTITTGTVTFSGATVTLTVGGNAGTDFTIAASQSLTLTGTGNIVNITMAASATSSISGTFTINSGATWTTSNASTVMTVNSGGTISNAGTITGATAAKLIFEGTSSYYHAQNGGTVPTADWNGATNTATSTCYITGVTSTLPSGITGGVGFYNFTWNCTSQSSQVSLSAASYTLCTNDFTISSTNSSSILLTSGGGIVVTVSGNVIHTGGTVYICASGSASASGLTVTGNYTFSGGTIYGNSGNGSGSGGSGAALTVNGNFSQTTGTFSFNPASNYYFYLLAYGNVTQSSGTISTVAGSTGVCAIWMTKSGSQTLSLSSTLTDIDLVVISGSTTTLNSNIGIGASTSATVNSGGTLVLDTYIISGSGTTTISSGSTVYTAYYKGFSTTTSTGCIQTTTRTYSSGASYIFNGTTSQVTGNFVASTTPTVNTVANLTFNNSNGITLSGNITIANGGTFTLTAGYHDLSSYTLAMGTSATANTLTYTAGGLYSSTNTGSFKRYIPNTVTITTSSPAYGLFPFARSSSLIGNIKITSTANVTAGGYISMIPTFGSDNVVTCSVADGGSTIVRAQVGNTVDVTVSSMTGGTNVKIEYDCGSNVNTTGSASDLCLVTYNSSTVSTVGTHVANAGTKASPQVARNTIASIATLNSNKFCLATYSTSSPVSLTCTLSGTKTVGPTGDYSTLTAAVTDLATYGMLSSVILELQTTYVSTYEVYPIVLSNFSCASSTITLSIYPNASATSLTISGSNSGGSIFTLEGADYITIDGRPGATGSTSQLAISNTATAAASNRTILLQNDATYNTIKYCSITGDNSSTTNSTAGVVFIGTATSGNSNNTIDNCSITLASSATSTGIVSYTASNSNSTNTISNCSIYDVDNYAIWCSTGSTAYTISANHVYQTVGSTTSTTGTYLINIATGTAYDIKGNYIGGSGKYCNSTAYYYLNATAAIYGIYFGGTGAGTNYIRNNYIKYLKSSSTTAANVAVGIYLNNPTSTTLYITNNIVGFIYTSSSSTATTHSSAGMYSTGTCSSLVLHTNKNTVTNIENNMGSSSSAYLYGIDFSSSTAATSSYYYNNYVNLDYGANASRIYCLSTGATSVIYNNTLYAYSGSNQTYARYCLQVVGTVNNTIQNNLFINASSSTAGNTKYSACINSTSTGGTQTHSYNYYQFTGTYSTSVQSNNAATSWTGETGGVTNTDVTLDGSGQASPSASRVADLGTDLRAATPAIAEDILSASRSDASPWIGCYESASNIFYSKTFTSNTDANTLTNWNSNRDGSSGSAPGAFSTSGYVFVIQPGHKYQNTATWTGSAAGYIKVESGGTIDLSSRTLSTWGSLKIEGTGVSNAGALINTSASSTSCSIPIILNADATITSSGSGGLTLTGGITGTGYALTIDGSYATTISTSGINTSTSGTLVKSGSGTLTVSASGTYTGLTTVSAGVLNIQNATALGTSAAGTTVTSGAALQLQGAAVVSETLTLNGTGVSSDGALRIISGTNSWSGAITLGSAVRINADAGTNTITGGITGTGYALTLGGAGSATISTSGINTSTSGTVTKDGAGTWTVSASGDYTGLTTVSAGVLNIQNATAIGTTAAGTTVASGAALEIQGGITVGSETLTLNNDGVSSGGSLRNVSGTNTWGGDITLSTNAVRINSDAGTLTLSGTITNAAINLTLGGAGAITANGVIGNGAGTLTKDGAGTLTLGATNTFTGAMSMSAGTVTLAANQSLSSTLTVSAGTLGISTYTIAVAGATSIAGTLTISTGTFDANGSFTASGGFITFSDDGYLYLGSTVTSLGTLTLSYGADNTTGCTVIYDAAGAQDVAAVDYYNLIIDGSGTKTLAGNVDIGGSNGEGVLTVDTGCTFAIGDNTVTHAQLHDFSSTYNSSIVGTVTLNNGIWTPTYGQNAQLVTSGAITVTGTGTIYLKGGGGHTLGTLTPGSGTVYYSRNGNQTVQANTFNHLIIDGTSGTKTLGGNVTVNGDFTTTANGGGVLALSTYTLSCKGAFTNNGTFTANTGTVAFTGTSAQTLSGSSAPTFYNLTINNSSTGVTLGVATTCTNTLTLTAGLIKTVSYTLTLGTSSANATVSGGSSTAYIVAYDNSGTIGYVKHFINLKASTAYSYPIGDLTNYTPFTFTVNTASTLAAGAYFTLYTKASTISGLSSSVTTYLTRFWRGTDSGITTPDYDISYTYSSSDVIGGTEANLMPIKKSGTTWYKPTGSTFTTGTAVGTGSFNSGTRTLSWTGLTSFSDYGGVGPAAVALPIELTTFVGKKVGSDNELIWSTDMEINNDYFTVEKTIDGESFEIIGTVNGAGNSQHKIDYLLFDNNVQHLINYYRLVQTDYDGKKTISNMISIDNREIQSNEKYIVSKTNILGQEINDEYRGLIIVSYSDGSSEKIIK